MSHSDERIAGALRRLIRGDHSEYARDNQVLGSLVQRRVRLISMGGDPGHAPGEQGKVSAVTTLGLLVVWDEGSLGFESDVLVPGRDEWIWLETPPVARYPESTILEALLRSKHDHKTREPFDDRLFESLLGRRVRLVFTNDETTDLGPGDEGYVHMIDSAGTVHVCWDRNLGPPGLIPGIDRWEWL
jgi:hypothetical protein